MSVNAANGDIFYSGNSSSWTCSVENTVSGIGTLNYNYLNTTYYFNIPSSYVNSYSGDNIDVTASGLYVPVSAGTSSATVSYDSNSGIFLNGSRISEYTFMGDSDFNMQFTVVFNSTGEHTSNSNYYYTFRYLRDINFTINKSSLTYVPSGDYYSLRFTARCYIASSSYGFYGLRNSSNFNVLSGSYCYWNNRDSFPLMVLTLKETNKVPSTNLPTYDSSTTNAVNNQTSKVEQGNQIAQQGNTIAQENSDTNKDTNNKITSFFNSFFDNLVHIFVPEDGFFSSWFNELNDFFAAKLGFLYAPFDFIISFFNGVLNTVGTQEHGFTIPALSWEGTEFCPEVHFSFDTFAEQFPQLQEAVYFFSDVVIILALLRGIKSKLDLVMGVHEE